MTKQEKIEQFKSNHLREWISMRSIVLDELSNKQGVFCTCGKLATGLHESNCLKFNKKVDSETYNRIMKVKIQKSSCDCQDFENGFVSMSCPIHNTFPVKD